MKYKRYLQIMAVATITRTFGRGKNKNVGTTTTSMPTFYLDKDVSGITMLDTWTPAHPEIVQKLVESIVNPFNDLRISVSFTIMVAHIEYQPDDLDTVNSGVTTTPSKAVGENPYVRWEELDCKDPYKEPEDDDGLDSDS